MISDSVFPSEIESSQLNSPWYLTNFEDWYSLFINAPTKVLNKGTVIFHRGDQLHYVYFIKQGRVKTSISDDNGQEKTILIFSAGSIFGEDAAVENSPYEVTTIANTICTLAYLPYKEFLDKVGRCPSLSMQLNRSLTGKIMRLTHQIKEIALLKSDERVIAYLLKLADTFGVKSDQGIKITISFTHQEMADLIASSRVSVAKIMSALNKDGILERIDGYIYIKSKVALLSWYDKRKD